MRQPERLFSSGPELVSDHRLASPAPSGGTIAVTLPEGHSVAFEAQGEKKHDHEDTALAASGERPIVPPATGGQSRAASDVFVRALPSGRHPQPTTACFQYR